MKIQTDQITSTQQTGSVQTTRSDQATNFGDILAKEVNGSQPSAAVSTASSLSGVASLTQVMATQAVEKAADVTSERQAVMDNVDNILNQWEKYSGQLASGSNAQLRQAYGTLENIQAGVQQLKDDYPNLAGNSPQLSSLVNELDVMAVTEKMKFNRGDYV